MPWRPRECAASPARTGVERVSTRDSPRASSRLRRAAIERKDLGRVQEPARIEHGFDPHLQTKLVLIELNAHEIALFDADPMLAGVGQTTWESLTPFLDDSGSNFFVRNIVHAILELHGDGHRRAGFPADGPPLWLQA